MIVGEAENNSLGYYDTLQFSQALQHIERLVSQVDAYLVQKNLGSSKGREPKGTAD